MTELRFTEDIHKTRRQRLADDNIIILQFRHSANESQTLLATTGSGSQHASNRLFMMQCDAAKRIHHTKIMRTTRKQVNVAQSMMRETRNHRFILLHQPIIHGVNTIQIMMNPKGRNSKPRGLQVLSISISPMMCMPQILRQSTSSLMRSRIPPLNPHWR